MNFTNGYPQAPYQYLGQNGHTQSPSQSGTAQQYGGQYANMESPQNPSNQTSFHSYQEFGMLPGTNMSFQHSFNQHRMPRTQSAPGMDDPLANIITDLDAVENVPVENFTTNLHAEAWRPSSFAGFTGYTNGNAAHSQKAFPIHLPGPMSEPTPRPPSIIDLSCDEASDSAYVTQPTEAASVYGASSQVNCNQSQSGADNRSQGKHRSPPSPARPRAFKHVSDSHIPPVRMKRKAIAPLPVCDICHEYRPKNASDAVKHRNKHIKPHKCQFQECRAKDVGFATPNDLDRHQKCGKHNMAPQKGSGKAYVCAACPVPPESEIKWWPRLDNFKAHITRRHKELDTNQLIKLSERDVRTKPSDAETQFGDTSTMFHGSIADPNESYQFPEPQSATGRTMPMFSSQGEASFWPHEHENSFLYPINEHELAGVGEAQHLADPLGPSRHVLNASVTNKSHAADGYSGLSVLAEVSSGRHLEVPSVTVHAPRNSSPKREADRSWEERSKVKRPRSIVEFEDAFDNSDAEGHFRCPEQGCDKVKKRKCDLRKHMKRHTRPYGCTFPRCYVRQGSRSDWKRHEDKQHSLPVAWKCTLKNGNGETCHAHAYTEKHFRQHLLAAHTPESQAVIEDHCTAMRLGRDAYDKFWCGLCRKVIPRDPTDKRGPRDVRCSHIGDHFDRDEGIDKWVCFELNKPYSEITKEEKRGQRKKWNDPPSDDDGVGEMRKLSVKEDAFEVKMLDPIKDAIVFGDEMAAGSLFEETALL